ncbi:hypothetical protein Y1Q_0002588 [Alligator mississippiensis]|uniref:Uncharacterized protein n=1 Tax=Alligator mississippiensis TaxID=8496 RepID=A0A151N3V1_ALLMI|nr:hypothetical protein Y1Q_0002588 [Alligator mississippiensis]
MSRCEEVPAQCRSPISDLEEAQASPQETKPSSWLTAQDAKIKHDLNSRLLASSLAQMSTNQGLLSTLASASSLVLMGSSLFQGAEIQIL